MQKNIDDFIFIIALFVYFCKNKIDFTNNAHFMKYYGVIFDLDGTLINSLEDIANCANLVLERHHLPTHPVNNYLKFIGEGAKMLIRKALPSYYREENTVELILKEYSEEYRKNCLVKTHIYNGLSEVLDILKASGISINVLSNKPDEFTKYLVNQLFKKWSFNIVLGHKPEFPRKPDPASALHIVKQLKIAPENLCYVGDSEVDIQTAKSAHISSIAVTWGFRNSEILSACKPEYLIHHPSELVKILV